MSSDRTVSSTRALSVQAAIAALLALSCVAGIPRPVHADEGGRRGHEFREHEFHREEFRDSRFHHDRYYPPRGYQFSVLPPHPHLIMHGGQQFYFSGGAWYRPAVIGASVIALCSGSGHPVPPCGMLGSVR